MQSLLQYIADPQNHFGAETVATLQMSIIPILIALVVSVPLGIALAQRPVAAFFAVNTSGLVRSVPTLAVLALVINFLGLGLRPSIFALSLLGVPPILLNTITGLRSIDPATVEAARGMGMTRWQILTRIQTPLMAPVLAAGVRNAAVAIVATVPLAALVGGGGYGDYVLAGINLLQTTPLLVGSIGIATFALVTELLLSQVQRALTPAGLRVAAPVNVGEEPVSSADATGSAPLAA
jgi:osmoprotectant transport system permease protein